jgi:hypothetical protein
MNRRILAENKHLKDKLTIYHITILKLKEIAQDYLIWINESLQKVKKQSH